MISDRLSETVGLLMAGSKGLLAMDESIGTADKRFAAMGIAQTPEMRRRYRQMLVTAPGLGQDISGAILFDETIRQTLDIGTSFSAALTQAGVLPGIKVDLGAKALAGHPGESVTEGLDGLRDRLLDYASLGARFAKWRAVIAVGPALPSLACLDANAHALARYAALCQDCGIVPIVEPEVLMDGSHDLESCQAATGAILQATFAQLSRQDIRLEAMILKPNMVLPGLASPHQITDTEAADATLTCLLRNVPAAVGGIAFLSGGQSPLQATARLNAMASQSKLRTYGVPWPLTFSFARAVQDPAMDIWRGNDANAAPAQAALVRRTSCNRAARSGQYTLAMEAK